jgi:hypothetical protein
MLVSNPVRDAEWWFWRGNTQCEEWAPLLGEYRRIPRRLKKAIRRRARRGRRLRQRAERKMSEAMEAMWGSLIPPP